MTEADRKIAMEWYEATYPRANQDAENDGSKSSWWQQREQDIRAFVAGLVAGREWAAGVADKFSEEWHRDYKVGHGPHRASEHREGMSDGAEQVAAEIRKGPQ